MHEDFPPSFREMLWKEMKVLFKFLGMMALGMLTTALCVWIFK